MASLGNEVVNDGRSRGRDPHGHDDTYVAMTPTRHSVSQSTTGMYISPSSTSLKNQHGYLRDASRLGDGSRSAASHSSDISDLLFPAFLDLLCMLAMLVTERSGDADNGVGTDHVVDTHDAEQFAQEPSAQQILELFFFRLYASSGVRDMVMSSLVVRSFFAAVDRRVRVIVQQRARHEAEEVDRQHAGNLRVMLESLGQ